MISDNFQKLFEKAKKVREKAHVPYSQFKVGAAFLTEDNSLVVGSPGKVIRQVTEEEKKEIFENTKHYQDNWKKYSKSIF